MKNITDYKKRFYNLMESTMGDVKPLINEEILSNPWTDTTTALQGIADYYNKALNITTYKKYPNKPKIYFSVKRTHAKDAVGNEIDVAWIPYFGETRLSMDRLPSRYIIDQHNLVSRPEITQRVNEFIATPISQKYNSIKGVTTMNITAAVKTAVDAINVALKNAKYTTKP